MDKDNANQEKQDDTGNIKPRTGTEGNSNSTKEKSDILMNLERYFRITQDPKDPKNNSVSLKLDGFGNREEMMEYLDRFFRYFYLENIEYNYTAFQRCIFEMEELKSRLEEIVIAKEIIDLDKEVINPITKENEPTMRDKLDQMGRKFRIFENKDNYVEDSNGVKTGINRLGNVDMIFSTLMKTSKNGKDSQINYGFPEVFIFLYRNGIRAGLKKENISKGLNKSMKVSDIAQSVRPGYGKSSRLTGKIGLFPTSKNRQIVSERDENDRVDIKSFNYIPQVSKEENDGLIAIKIKPTRGDNGIQFDGTLTLGFFGKDEYNEELLAGDGIEVTYNGELVEFRGQFSGFLNVETDGYIDVIGENGKETIEKIRKISVSENWTYSKTNIGKETGNTDVSCIKKFILGGGKNVMRGFKLFGNTIRIERGNVEGEVYSNEGSVNVFGDVLSGKIEAYDGNIFIHGNVSMFGSYIEAQNGIIEVEKKSEFATFVCDEFIGNEVNGCIIICNKCSIKKGGGDNIIFRKSVVIDEVITDKINAKKGEGVDKMTDNYTNIFFLGRKYIIGNQEVLFNDQNKIASFIDDVNMDDRTKSMKLVRSEEFNRTAESISDKSVQETEKKDFYLDINNIGNNDFFLMYLTHFQDFEISRLNEKGRKFKEDFLKELLLLLEIKKASEELSISQARLDTIIDPTNNHSFYRGDPKKLKLDFSDFEKILAIDSNSTNIRRLLPVEGPNKRNAFRVNMLEKAKFEENLKANVSAGTQIWVSLNGIKYLKGGLIKDFSPSGVAFFIPDNEETRQYLFMDNKNGVSEPIENKVIKSIKFSLKGEDGKNVYFDSRLLVIQIEKNSGYFTVRGQLVFLGEDKQKLLDCWRKMQINN
ncbi:MAG: FapA family protein [Candidatus Gracilibacteria bacterium]|nr:FapA family protein [Candidatus Gracilibacteria bacterium]